MSAEAIGGSGFPERREPAFGRAFVLALLVHLILLGAMFIGVRWQSHSPQVVTVELWEPPPPPPPKVEPKPEPKPEPPPPPKVEPKPEPKVEKPDIVVREKPKPPPPKPKPPPPKPVAKPEPPKPDPAFEKRLQEQLAMEQRSLEDQRILAERQRQERELRDLLARQQASARQNALNVWKSWISAAIRGRILTSVADDVPGNPEAKFVVTILPSGDVLNVTQRKSSGHPAYDAEVQRAIRASSPLPKPEDPALFERVLELTFRPKDK